MPCGKRPLVKKWTKPKQLRVVVPSVLEKNEASVKIHWKKVIRDLELFYKDDQFWESQCETVRELVGPKIFHRLAKIFNLPLEATEYVPRSEHSIVTPSEEYYLEKTGEEGGGGTYADYSMSDFVPSVEEELLEEESIEWSMSSSVDVRSRSKSMIRSKSFVDSNLQIKSSKSFSKSMSKSFSRMEKGTSRMLSKSMSGKWRKSLGLISSVPDESAATDDDLIVHGSSLERRGHPRRKKNPHFDMLYCNESETDMIKWNSKYKQKVFEVSASDEFSKKAEIKTKQIAKEFYDWWVGLGNVEFKSEIKRPEDIEDLFQVWFDEHASRGLVLDPKILPCVLQSIANFVGVPRASCPRVLKRQIAFDIRAETSPEHTVAFGTCLPQRMKHIPPKNNTANMWHCLKIPEDLKSMAAVWDDVVHLTSTKAFHQWLKSHPGLPMPPYLQQLDADSDKKQPFVVPSDFLLRDRSSAGSSHDLALPVSEFSMELKDVLSKLMNE